MNAAKSLGVSDCIVFGVLTALGYLVGLYFALSRRWRKATSDKASSAGAEMEAFLGGQSIPAAALAVSVLASVANGTNVVGFVGHYYAYGFHTLWVIVGAVAAATFSATVLVPLLYGLRVASIFQYLRLRFDNKVGITACIVYFFLSQTLGAVGIYSAAIGVSTMFSVSVVYTCIAIGLAGTVYTALGGLRGVVWADCVQALVMFVSPLTIIAKVIYDASNVTPPLRPLTDINATDYMFRRDFDITSDENVWSCLIGGLPYIFVRMGFDQMVVQRYMAARTAQAAKAIALSGAVFVEVFFLLVAVAGLTIIYWYRDCDPVLSGVIGSYDQIVPFYIRENLSGVTALRGLFLAGLLGATTSTVSSVVNSHAATFYIDVVVLYFKMSERRALNVMRLLALASGAIMTTFSIAVPYMGTASRLFMSLYASASGPFAGLVLLAVSSPWVNAKGAAWASVLVCILQLWHAVGKHLSGAASLLLLPGTLDRCPVTQNISAAPETHPGTTATLLSSRPQVFPLYQMSFFWSSFVGALLTVILGTAFGIATGGLEAANEKKHLTSPVFLNTWRRFKLLREILQVDEEVKNINLRMLTEDEESNKRSALDLKVIADGEETKCLMSLTRHQSGVRDASA